MYDFSAYMISMYRYVYVLAAALAGYGALYSPSVWHDLDPCHIKVLRHVAKTWLHIGKAAAL